HPADRRQGTPATLRDPRPAPPAVPARRLYQASDTRHPTPRIPTRYPTTAHDRTAMARRYVSVKEIAAKAGVSFQTASKVLNGGNVRVSAETAARIMAVAEKLGYRPNTVARSLAQQT